MDNGLIIKDSIKTIDSREVAEMIEMRHTDLLRKVAKYEDILTNAKLRSLDFFISNEYQDSKGETRKCYLLTKKGCDMVANKLTGEKGVIFTAKYVNRFEEMEKELSVPQIKTDPMSLLKLTYDALEQTNDRVAKVETDVKDIKENQAITPGEYNYVNKKVKNRIRYVKDARNLNLTKEQNSKLYSALGRDLASFTGVRTRSQIRSKDFEKAVQFINDWEPSYTDLKIISQMALDI
ncbi:Rha family transcriptional regulator [Erysipelatoclostridium ramosum]|uniref:Rha family transcriptional regulator n=1 Tax=Thomasclavelia ramosa TaxID=1547 RepID=UPI00189EE045|nr:Rha family transcriptional regulator [Thomasclavelia ramosa]MDB7040474.1 Rha family transcriptional regulator [Thomasclavelia ramosa]